MSWSELQRPFVLLSPEGLNPSTTCRGWLMPSSFPWHCSSVLCFPTLHAPPNLQIKHTAIQVALTLSETS